MKIDTHPRCCTRDIEAQRSGKATHEMEGNSHIIADIDNLLQFGGRHGKRMREILRMKPPRTASYPKGDSRVSSAGA